MARVSRGEARIERGSSIVVGSLLSIALLALNYWAVTRIIGQAGYSRLWVILPLAPLVLTIIALAVTRRDIQDIFDNQTGTFGTTPATNLGALWLVDGLCLLGNWIFFLIFAFSRWPVAQGGGSMSPGVTGPTTFVSPPAPAGGPRFGPNPIASSPSARLATPTTQTTAWSPSTASVAPPTLKYCVLCGDPLPGSRALFHDCGAKDRPAMFCVNCGSALPEAGVACSSCA
jgi:hypothetical protein